MGKPSSNSNTTRKTKSAKKRTAAKPRPAEGRRRQTSTGRQAPSSVAPISRDGTKGAKIVAMLRGSAGATIATMMSATSWQPHSVRGFLAGVVRKKLKLNLVSEPGDKGRVYRIKERKTRAAASDSIGAS